MTIKHYTTGFVACFLLTAASFGITQEHLATGHQFPSHPVLGAGILILAVIQLVVQLVFFLHVGRESQRRDVLALMFAGVLVFIVVGGSLWIMANLTHSDAVPFDNSSITPQAETD